MEKSKAFDFVGRYPIEAESGIACKDCKQFRPELDVLTDNELFANCARADHYCNTERTLRHCCGPSAKYFQPTTEYQIKNYHSDVVQFSLGRSAFWLDPARWDGIEKPNLRDPGSKVFWA